MVMKYMRTGTKPILWILVAAFVGTIIFAWGMEFTSRQTYKGVIAEVNGVEIKGDDYSLMYQNSLAQQQQQKGAVSDEDAERLKDQVFDQMVGSHLLQQVTQKVGLTVTNRELAEHLRRFPPQEIRSLEYFQTDGQFDYKKYLQAYQNPDPQLWLQIEMIMRPRVLQQKLYEYVTAASVVDDADVKELYDAASEKVRVRFLYLATQKLSDSVPQTDSATIEKYYREHIDQYRHAERAQIKYVSFEKKPSAADSAEVSREALDVARRARDGEDFATLVRQFSEDPSSPDGDLGWFGKGAMVPQFEAAAFAMDSGQISDPVASRFGIHVIKVDGRRGLGDSIQVKAAHVLFKVEASAGTLSDLRLRAEQFAGDLKSNIIDSLATQYKVAARRSGWFERGQDIAGLGRNQGLVEFAFSNPKSAISTVIEMPTNFLVATIEAREPEGTSPLSDMQRRIGTELHTKALRDLAYQRLSGLLPELQAGLPFADAAARVGAAYDSTGSFGRLDPVPIFGDDPAFRGAAFALTRGGTISPAIKVQRGAAILQLLDHVPADPQKYADKRDSIMIATIDGSKQMVFNKWYEQLKAGADIKDFRYQIQGGY